MLYQILRGGSNGDILRKYTPLAKQEGMRFLLSFLFLITSTNVTAAEEVEKLPDGAFLRNGWGILEGGNCSGFPEKYHQTEWNCNVKPLPNPYNETDFIDSFQLCERKNNLCQSGKAVAVYATPIYENKCIEMIWKWECQNSITKPEIFDKILSGKYKKWQEEIYLEFDKYDPPKSNIYSREKPGSLLGSPPKNHK